MDFVFAPDAIYEGLYSFNFRPMLLELQQFGEGESQSLSDHFHDKL